MVEAQAMFLKAFESATGDAGRLDSSWSTIQITMYAKVGDERSSEVAVKFVLEGEGQSQ